MRFSSMTSTFNSFGFIPQPYSLAAWSGDLRFDMRHDRVEIKLLCP